MAWCTHQMAQLLSTVAPATKDENNNFDIKNTDSIYRHLCFNVYEWTDTEEKKEGYFLLKKN